MGQFQKFSNYFLVCGGVKNDPCKLFLQNRIEPEKSFIVFLFIYFYLGLPLSSDNRNSILHPVKIFMRRLCQTYVMRTKQHASILPTLPGQI